MSTTQTVTTITLPQQKRYTLNNGTTIPAIGFGTWKAAPGEAGRAVEAAFDAGYRHFDCAPLYYNESEIGQVFANTKVPRNEYFVTTKLWSSSHRNPGQALDNSLRDLQLDYVDLYLMHWPISLPPDSTVDYGKEDRTKHDPSWTFNDTWREMEKLLSTGKVKAIGVANFSTVNLEKLLKTAKVVPAVNQTEIQPLLPQDKLYAFCQRHGIIQTAFGPLGGSQSSGSLHSHPLISKIAKTHGTGTANVMISWGVQKGWSVVPKSTNKERIAQNLNGNVVLSDEEMREIDEMPRAPNGRGKRFNVPNWGVTVFHDDEGLDLEA